MLPSRSASCCQHSRSNFGDVSVILHSGLQHDLIAMSEVAGACGFGEKKRDFEPSPLTDALVRPLIIIDGWRNLHHHPIA